MVKRRAKPRLTTGRATSAAAKSARRPADPPKAAAVPTPAGDQSAGLRTEPRRAGEPTPPMIPCTVRMSATLRQHITTVSTNARQTQREEPFYADQSAMIRAALEWAKAQADAGKPIARDVLPGDRSESRVRLPKPLKEWYMGHPRGTCPDVLESAIRGFIKQL